MPDRFRLQLAEPHAIDHGALLKQKRASLGWTIDMVSARLLLSTSQVRGLESNSTSAFYNARFFERARDRYLALLDAHTSVPHVAADASPALVMTLAVSPAGQARGWSS